jgi:predicted transcriptional regulator of viral defense system
MESDLPDIVRLGDQSSLSKRRIAALVAGGVYERVAPGIYARTDAVDDTTAALASVALRQPEATLCLLSALSIHDLTDEIPAASHVALPRGANRLVVRWAPVEWHFFDRATFEIGREQYVLPGSVQIGLYSAERTIIDVFRLRHVWGSDLAVEALRRWLRRRGSSPGALMNMAANFPAARPALQSTLEVLT